MASHNLNISNIPFVVDERSINKVYLDAVNTMRIESLELQPLYLQTLVKVATDALGVIFQGMPYDLSVNRARVGIIAIEVLAKRCCLPLASWEIVLWEVLSLIKEWKADVSWSMTSNLREWVLNVFSSPDMCSNPYLRLEMLYLINLFPITDYEYKSVCVNIVSGMVMLIKYLDCDELNIQLIRRLVNILCLIHQHGQLDNLANQAVHQVRSLKVGPEARSLTQFISLASRLARHNKHAHKRNSSRKPYYISITHVSTTTRRCFSVPGICATNS